MTSSTKASFDATGSRPAASTAAFISDVYIGNPPIACLFAELYPAPEAGRQFVFTDWERDLSHLLSFSRDRPSTLSLSDGFEVERRHFPPPRGLPRRAFYENACPAGGTNARVDESPPNRIYVKLEPGWDSSMGSIIFSAQSTGVIAARKRPEG